MSKPPSHWPKLTQKFATGASGLRSARQMDCFRSVLEDCSLDDLGFSGPWFIGKNRWRCSKGRRKPGGRNFPIFSFII
ncbi:hypothetical protein V6N12_070518 [Hibiscus sabdariffa]|uniref:Uncharacterized protein n=1 Tax=Hibiscus sabdariffa TaxID=183260 RepID=A0ABR2FH83_9ROSI